MLNRTKNTCLYAIEFTCKCSSKRIQTLSIRTTDKKMH